MILIVLNLRGIKESIRVLVPIFLLFIGTHVLLILTTIVMRLSQLDDIVVTAAQDASATSSQLGWFALALIMMRAYSLGGGTYTGIEAVSNSVQVLREPRVANAKRTMLYMAVSLAFTAGGIIIGYLLVGARPVPDRTMNAVFAQSVFGDWTARRLRRRTGPRRPDPRFRRRPALRRRPDRIPGGAARSGQHGGGFLGAAPLRPALGPSGREQRHLPDGRSRAGHALVHPRFGLEARRHVLHQRLPHVQPDAPRAWCATGRSTAARPTGSETSLCTSWASTLCTLILVVTVYEKFEEGGWLTVIVTTTFVTLAFSMKAHYTRVRNAMRRIDETLLDIPVRPHGEANTEIPPDEPVAVMLVNGFTGMGIHTVLSVQNLFPHQFKNYLFLSVGVIDSENFKGVAEIDALRRQTETDLIKYVAFARQLGFRAEYRYDIGTEAVEAVVKLCDEVHKEYPRSIFFLGQLVFESDRFYYRFLHNETAFAIQRRLQFAGLQAIVLPIRVLERKKKKELKKAS